MTGPPSVRPVRLARRSDPGRVERLFGIVEEAIRSRAPAQADALLATLHEHLHGWQPHLLDGVNPLLRSAGALVSFDRAFEGRGRAWFHSVRVLARKAGDYEPSRRARGEGPFATRALDLLADPATKAPLSARRGQLVCAGSGVAYPVHRGVPDFLQPGPVRRFRLR